VGLSSTIQTRLVEDLMAFTAEGRNRNRNQDILAIRQIGTNDENSVDLTDLPHLCGVHGDMDLEFVENFDYTYNE
jgi:hypothetical protein